MRVRFSLVSHLIPYYEGTTIVLATLLMAFKRRCQHSFSRVQQRVLRWTRPRSRSFLTGTLTDLARTRTELVAENALLRQPLIILRRQVKRLSCSRSDRLLLVVLARAARNWKQALCIVQPATLLGWHRQAFRWFWRRRSQAASRYPRIPAETVVLIETMALNNRLWGAERLRGSCSNWAFTSPNAPFRNTCSSCVHILQSRPGVPVCTTMRTRFGPATSWR
jgi:putative transposase